MGKAVLSAREFFSKVKGAKADLLQEGQLFLGLRSHSEQFWLEGGNYKYWCVTPVGNYSAKPVLGEEVVAGVEKEGLTV